MSMPEHIDEADTTTSVDADCTRLADTASARSGAECRALDSPPSKTSGLLATAASTPAANERRENGMRLGGTLGLHQGDEEGHQQNDSSVTVLTPTLANSGDDGRDASATIGTAEVGCENMQRSSAEKNQDEKKKKKDEMTVASRPSSASSSASHLHRWHLPEETLIVFDWDDTLCPTTMIIEDRRLCWSTEAPCWRDKPDMPLVPGALPQPSSTTSDTTQLGRGTMPLDDDADAASRPTMAEALRQHVQVAANALRSAAACGCVVIVTLGKKGWVETSCRNFLPGLADVIEDLGIRVIYARGSLSKWKIRCASAENLDILQLMKQAAIGKALKKLYSTHKGQTWKNAVSIGDSETERDALVEVMFNRIQPDKFDRDRRSRCKTVLLPEAPDLLQLTAELEVISAWIHHIVLYDDDVALDLSNAEDAIMMMEKMQQLEEPSPPEDGEGNDAAGAFGDCRHPDGLDGSGTIVFETPGALTQGTSGRFGA
jgi:hypothetical protein